MRSRRTVVIEERFSGDERVKEYVDGGYGVILIPDLSPISGPSADYFLTVTADQIQEFLKDGQEVVILGKKDSRWVRSLDRKLAERNLRVKRRELE